MFLLCLISGGFLFIINVCWISSKAFSASIEIIMWFLSFKLLILCITMIDLKILKNPCITGIKTTWSWCSVQFSSVTQSCPTLCDPMKLSMPGLPVHHHLSEFTQTHVHQVSDAIQPSHPRSSPSPPAPNPFQHQSLFQWVNSSHEVSKALELQL